MEDRFHGVKLLLDTIEYLDAYKPSNNPTRDKEDLNAIQRRVVRAAHEASAQNKLALWRCYSLLDKMLWEIRVNMKENG